MADKTSGGGNDYVGTHLKTLKFLIVAVAVVAAIYSYAANAVEIIAKALHGLVDLLSQLTCRTHYDTVDSVLRESAVVKTREDRQQIGSGLARTSLCYTKKVAAFEYRRNTLFLYGGAYVKAHVV